VSVTIHPISSGIFIIVLLWYTVSQKIKTPYSSR